MFDHTKNIGILHSTSSPCHDYTDEKEEVSLLDDTLVVIPSLTVPQNLKSLFF